MVSEGQKIQSTQRFFPCAKRTVFALVCWLYAVGGMAQYPVLAPSGTLPVLYINTTDSITSKETYVSGTYYLDNMGHRLYESVGSAEAPLALEIRGRGNWTWTGPFAKKPYKLKLGSKQSLLGMDDNKHFALLAHADGKHAFFRNTLAFYISRQLQLDFTPAEQPVELMLNGHYEGLYFLTETVRVGKHRVNITEQENGETDPDLLTGGWLVELDNAVDDHQVRLSVRGTDLGWFWVTYHSPDSLSLAQRTYLRKQMSSLLSTVYVADKSSTEWERIIDVPTLARYYMVYEILDNPEGFLGSCYLYKDRGEEKWKFGPVWDLGNALNDDFDKQEFSYIYHNGWYPGIINEIARFPRFQQEVLRVWNMYYRNFYPSLPLYLNWYTEHIGKAAVADSYRWGYTIDMEQQRRECMDMLQQKIDFLISQWGNPTGVPRLTVSDEPAAAAAVYSLSGQPLHSGTHSGFYIQGNRKFFRRK